MEINGDLIVTLIRDVSYIKSTVKCIDRKVGDLSKREHCNSGQIARLKGQVEVIKGVKLPLTLKLTMVLSVVALVISLIKFLLT